MSKKDKSKWEKENNKTSKLPKENNKPSKTDKDKDKLAKFDARGVQTLFRTQLRNHYSLKRMVDNKASIILTMNSIVISLMMGIIYMAPTDSKEVLQFGAKVLLNFGMASMVFALLALLSHRYSNRNKGSLYAGTFSKLSLEDYKEEMGRIMESGNSLYDEMMTDLYYLGKSISIKQKLIFISVCIFLTGLVISIINTLYHGVMIEKLFFG